MFVFMVYAVRGRGKNHSVLRLTVDNDRLESRKRQEGDVTEIIDVTVTVCREIRSGDRSILHVRTLRAIGTWMTNL